MTPTKSSKNREGNCGILPSIHYCGGRLRYRGGVAIGTRSAGGGRHHRRSGRYSDVTVRLKGGQRKVLSAGCNGTHDYRVELTASYAGQITKHAYTRKVTIRR